VTGVQTCALPIFWSWVIIVALVFLALILRLTLIPRMKDVRSSKGQNLLELAVETIEKYTKETAGGTGELLASYIFTITVFLVGCAVLELFGVRSPASDITLTGALAIVTFILINVYGLRRKGVAGRVKSLASPTPIILPIRIVTDLALPISLACRLFGNMLGGLVVMDLLYSALGDYAVGIPSLAGLYFNVFHPLIQTFIFITLTLTFINEAIE
jgi:F-type H+-transporting ATPase subunit a